MQNKTDMLGRPIEVPAVEEASPLGAAILAGIGVGLYRDEHEAYNRVCRPGKTYLPDDSVASRYAQWRPIYRQLYPATRCISHHLFEVFLT
jgi:autoinducer 2 (AI-2) kinase